MLLRIVDCGSEMVYTAIGGYVENYFKYTLENVIQQDAKKILRPDPIQHLVRFQEFANLSLVENPFTEFFDLNTGLIREWCT